MQGWETLLHSWARFLNKKLMRAAEKFGEQYNFSFQKHSDFQKKSSLRIFAIFRFLFQKHSDIKKKDHRLESVSDFSIFVTKTYHWLYFHPTTHGTALATLEGTDSPHSCQSRYFVSRFRYF